MFQGTENEAFLAYVKIQSLLSDNEPSSSLNDFVFESEEDVNEGSNPEERLIPSVKARENIFHELFPSTSSADSVFQELLQECMRKYSDCIIGEVPSDNMQHADVTGRYALAIAKRYSESDRLSASLKGVDAQLQREALEDKAERDLWSLLEVLCRSNLLDDIDDTVSENNLQSIISSLPVTASIPDFINSAYAHDQRIRKGAVLKEWLERAASDKLEVASAPHSIPSSETLRRILRENNRPKGQSGSGSGELVQSMHPDAQLGKDGLLLPLDGLDRLDQEALYKSVFALIRSGQIPRAQQLAADHRVYWLAASLVGISSHFHKTVELGDVQDGSVMMEQENAESNVLGISRVGNARQPVWARTCWKHCVSLSGNPNNWSGQVNKDTQRDYDDLLFGGGGSGSLAKNDRLLGTLECSIYAALSNNTKVLLDSPLLTSWHDLVWVLVKAAHERDLSKVLHRYRCLKSAHSALYPGCDDGVIAAERELLELGKLEIGHMSTGSCTQIFNKVPPPSTLNAESLLLKLQAAVMEGRSGIDQFLSGVMVPVLRAGHTPETLRGLPKILRVFCHFVIWLKYSPLGGPMAPLVSDEVLFLSIEKYVDYLIETRQYTLIAPYAAYLNRPRRIAQYSALLRAIRTSADVAAGPEEIHQPSGQSAEAAEVLQLASVFFPLDVMDITRAVVESTQITASQPSKAVAAIAFGAVSPSSSPTAAHSTGGRNVHFSETAVNAPITPQASRSVAFSTPSAGAERFAAIRGRQATPGILRHTGAQVEPESPGGAAPLESSAVSLLPEQPSEQEKELMQMESLRWLFFDPSHRLEAVKQTNRLISTLLSESAGTKLSQVRLLLTEYLPYDSVTVGYALLKQRLTDVENAVSDHMIRRQVQMESGSSVDDRQAQEEDVVMGRLKEAVALDELCWASNVCKLELWKSLVGAMEDFDAFKNLVIEYSSAASQMIGSPIILRSSLGKYRSKVQEAAKVAVAAISRTIECLPYSTDYQNPAEGYKDIWTKADEAVRGSVQQLLINLRRELDEYRAEAAHITGEDNSEILLSIRREVSEVEQLASRVSSDVIDGEDADNIGNLLGQLPGWVHGCPTNDSDLLLKVYTALNQVKLSFVDHVESLSLRGILINKLLSSNLQVCMDCAAVMSSLEHPKDACLWYYSAVKLANLIASDDVSLQLEGLLSRHDLELILSTINKACINAIKIDPDFNVV